MFKTSKEDDLIYIYQKAYIDGFKNGQENVKKEIIEMIEFGLIDSLEDLKRIMMKVTK